jgi:hypothetical protein
LDLIGFVNEVVTVVVDSVAGLVGGDRGVAIGEASLGTDALSSACSYIVGHLAIGPERERGRLGCAGA